jgi:molybdate transport system permease protein
MKRIFIIPLILIILFIIGMLVALLSHVSSAEMIRAVSSADTLFALRLSLITSLMAICNSVLLALPSAYLMARCNFFGKAAVDVLLDLPLVMPPLVAGVGLLFLFGEPLLNKALAQLGLHLIFTRWGAVAAQTFIAAPILTRSCRAAFEAVNPRYELAGRTLGLSGFQVFFIITLPMARQGILAGMILKPPHYPFRST